MEKLYDVTAMGEMLIDLTLNGHSGRGIICWRLVREARHAMYWRCSIN